MSDWIELDPESYSIEDRTEVSSGVEVVVGLSPFDIPEKVRGQYDEELKRFVIDFAYLDESERRIPKELDQHVTIRVGENSHRLYTILIDVDAIGVQAVQLSLVTEAIERFAQDSEARQKKLFGVAKRIVETKGPELVSSH